MEVGAEPAKVERPGETPQRLVWFARVVLLNFRSQRRCQGGELSNMRSETIARFARIARPNDQTSKTNTSLRRRPHVLDVWRILHVLSRTRAELAGKF
jgi:hypothetical protein